ncbi:MAG: hypothetical protein HYZ53_09840 [Planctomycetes bacterium]|nr:hypothetical protein [Planctomycetota bacterium]
MGPLLYALCAATSLACTLLLLKAYARTRGRLLLWGGLCFALMTLNNFLVIADILIWPEGDLFVFRLTAALCGKLLLLYGLIHDTN